MKMTTIVGGRGSGKTSYMYNNVGDVAYLFTPHMPLLHATLRNYAFKLQGEGKPCQMTSTAVHTPVGGMFGSQLREYHDLRGRGDVWVDNADMVYSHVLRRFIGACINAPIQHLYLTVTPAPITANSVWFWASSMFDIDVEVIMLPSNPPPAAYTTDIEPIMWRTQIQGELLTETRPKTKPKPKTKPEHLSGGYLR